MTRIVMFGGHPFCRNWLAAARCIADVTYVRPLERNHYDERLTDVEPVPGVSGLFASSSDPKTFDVLLPADLPYRVVGRHADRPNVRSLARVLDHLSAAGPIDLLHGHFSAGSRMFPALQRRLGIPYVVTEHSTGFTRLNPEQSPSKTTMRIARDVYGNAALVLPVSKYLEACLVELGLPGEFEVVPNPVAPEPFSLSRDDEGGTFELVCVARLAQAKAVDVLLRALARVVADHPRVHLTLVGTGREDAALRALTVSLGLAPHVTFAGDQPNAEIPRILARSHLFVMSSLVENLSIAVIEALFAGLPVIATDVGGQRELVDQDNGRLVQVGDDAALAAAIGDVVTGRLTFDRAAIAERARQRYSSEAVAEHHLRDVYARATSRPIV